MQQSALRSQFDVAGTARVCDSGNCSEPNAFRRAIFSALVLVATGCQISLAGESEDCLLDFTAKWCGPCQQMTSVISRLERQGAPIRKVDVDNEPGLAEKYGVKSIPCFVLVSNGREVDRVTGLTTEKQLVSMLNRLPKAAPISRSAQGASSDEITSTPKLGTPVPISFPKSTEQPRNSPPSKFAGFNSGREQRFADATDAPKFLGQSPDEASDPMQAGVRIRVRDAGAVSFGSGTIIDSRPGQSVVLTCGHIFRDLSKEAVVEVDVYPASKLPKPDTIIGKVLHSDLKADVGILTIATARPLPYVKLALPDKALLKQDRLVSIGCSGGDKPTREELQLTAINKYDGPENLECTGLPQQGRSGGGLFRGNELVGICIAADPKQNRGIYTGLKPIAVILDKVGLASLCPRLPASTPFNGSGSLADLSRGENKREGIDPGSAVPGHSAAGLDEVNRMLANELNVAGELPHDLSGAEVVCIVRSRTPGVPSRVIIVNQASDRFVADLLHESRGDAGIRQADRGVLSDMNSGLPPSSPVETSFEPKPYRRTVSK